jgi:hypothetical protein
VAAHKNTFSEISKKSMIQGNIKFHIGKTKPKTYEVKEKVFRPDERASRYSGSDGNARFDRKRLGPTTSDW